MYIKINTVIEHKVISRSFVLSELTGDPKSLVIIVKVNNLINVTINFWLAIIFNVY